jgi:hypothetical protein
MKDEEKMTYDEFMSWAQYYIADGIITSGFKSLSSSLFTIFSTYRWYEKNGFKK